MSETTIGKLWLRTDEDGSQRLGGVVLQDVPAGSHIRIRKNRNARSRRDGQYLLCLVVEPKSPPAKPPKTTAAPKTNTTSHSFDVPDEE